MVTLKCHTLTPQDLWSPARRRHHMLACNKCLLVGLLPRRYGIPVAKLDPNKEGVQRTKSTYTEVKTASRRLARHRREIVARRLACYAYSTTGSLTFAAHI